MTILVTGATGQLGQAVVKHLLAHIPAAGLAVSVRNPAKAAPLARQGIDVRQGDFNDLALMTTAFRGIDTALIISGEDDIAQRIAQHRNVIDAARAAGVRHVVYTSFIDARPDSAFTYAAIHADTETTLAQSGLSHTILRNSYYTDLLLAGVPHARETGHYGVPGGTGRVNYITRNDLAEIAANVLRAPQNHLNKTYNLAGTPISYADIAAIISSAIGKPVSYVDLPPQIYRSILEGLNMPGHLVTALIGMFEGVRAGAYDHQFDDAATLLGRAPQSTRDFLNAVLS